MMANEGVAFLATTQNSTYAKFEETKNSTDEYGLPDEFRWSLFSLYIVIIIFSIGGNGVICYTVYSMRNFRTVTNFFIVSLAVTDIMMTCLCIPFTVLSNLIFYYWPFGHFLCPFVGYIQLMSVFQRSFTLVALTCDRYYVARKPLKPRLSKRRAKSVILTLWFFSICLSLPTAVFSRIIYLPEEPGSFGLCVEIWKDNSARYFYGVVIMLLQYFLPLLLMTVTYIHIGYIIWAKQTPGEADSLRDRRIAESKRKTVKMIIAVVCSYMLCWLPLHVITLIGEAHPSIFDHAYIHMIWLTSHWLAFCNTGINPIIYFWMNARFRRGFLHIYGNMCCCWRAKLSLNDSFRLQSFRRTSFYKHAHHNGLGLDSADDNSTSPINHRDVHVRFTFSSNDTYIKKTNAL